MSKAVIGIVTYSTYGHIAKMAQSVIKGAEQAGVTVKVYSFKETLTEEILTKMHAGGSLNPPYPIITPEELIHLDGVIMGFPTRRVFSTSYGRAPAQVSSFFDACGKIWGEGKMVGKMVTIFTSAAGQHGGHEATALTTMPFFVHHGMCYVPIGYTHPFVNQTDTMAGNSPYGASCIASADGSRQPSAEELAVAEHQGKYFAEYVATFIRGKQA
ncbi:hypothetical protein TREMEDRAFT_43670 [Tremella mesenterica DSM 1558]|uniref:uncharacterized protein n=1 Tax=Tremella mesenterica (strain ATCC 24925 / CBS 8224 / DSM 1558 / NBRC 9311 / NRRL Y-6157 / RJB 2259-6 / UBC 559-6) TaxID=578456 RepID=UPI0003F49352|nr:uncharacterized protein TREMEDRAFT_43670 [Tremella mesenterica DSM 1558]EIW70052.1 hypothetical protein TREMEDRAFT_43670 [Tremella mesenterica DSM 1558]